MQKCVRVCVIIKVCVCVHYCLHTVDVQGHESGSNRQWAETARTGARNV